jgi:hypothetical protein
MRVTGVAHRGLRWLALAVGLLIAGVIVATGGLLLAGYQDRRWLPAARWWALSIYSVFLFGYVIRDLRRVWGALLLWVAIAILFGLHLVGYVWLLGVVKEWRNIWFLPLVLAEYAVFAYVLDWAVARRGTQR